MPAAELATALEYRKQQAAGHGTVTKVSLRRLTQTQYNNTVRDLLKDTTNPGSYFPPEDYVNGSRTSAKLFPCRPF